MKGFEKAGLNMGHSMDITFFCCSGQENAEVAVSSIVLNKKHKRGRNCRVAVLVSIGFKQQKLAADNKLDTGFFSLFEKLRHVEYCAIIGDSNSLHAELQCRGKQFSGKYRTALH